MPEYKYDAFLSYNSKDKEIITSIARQLKDDGIKVWFDVWNMRAGMTWQEALEQALQSSRAVVVFTGADGFGKWENEEMRVAIEARVRNPDAMVIPVLLPKVSKDYLNSNLLLSRHSAVFYGDSLDDADAFHRLSAGIRGEEPGDQQYLEDQKKGTTGEDSNKSMVDSSGHLSKPDELLYFVNQVDIIKFITSAQSPAYHLIDAPAGFGKTTLMRELQFRFDESGWLCCYVAMKNPKTSNDVICEIAQQLKIQTNGIISGKDVAQALMKQYSQKFCTSFENGIVLFIDLEKPLPS